MPIEVKHQSFADCETLTIFGAKRGKGNSTNLVRVQFSDLDDLKKFQNELDNIFPENIKLDKKFKEPEEEGLYLTTTGLLLNKDSEGSWSIRTFYGGEPYTCPSLANVLGENEEDYETDWLKIIKKLGAKAFPLTHIARRTQLSFSRKREDDAGNANGGGLLHHPDRHTALL